MEFNAYKDDLDQFMKTLQKMVIHKAEIDDIRATRDSLLTLIDDVLQRNSASDIVMAADELPHISDNTSVPPTYKQPEIADYHIIIQSVRDLVKHKRQVCTTGYSSSHRTNGSYSGIKSVSAMSKDHRDDVVVRFSTPIPTKPYQRPVLVKVRPQVPKCPLVE